jgi:DNA-binding transcriptional LysR family regulator
LRRFQETSPGVKVSLHDFSTEQMLAGLRDDSLDAALMAKTSSAALRGLQFRNLVTYHVCVAAHPTHPLARKRRVPLADLAVERLIAYSRREYPEYHEFMQKLFAGGKRRPQIGEEHDSVSSLIAAVESGRGVAIVTESLRCLVGARLVLRPLSPAPEPFCVGVVTPLAEGHPALERFVEALNG